MNKREMHALAATAMKPVSARVKRTFSTACGRAEGSSIRLLWAEGSLNLDGAKSA